MTSTSGLGSTSITLRFDLSRSIDGAASDVQTAINAASGLLPKDLPNPPTYRKTNPANAPVLIYAVHSDAYPIQDLDQYANTLLAQSLSRIDGVGQVIIAGQQQPAVDVRLNPNALSSMGLGFAQVASAIQSASVDQPRASVSDVEFTLLLTLALVVMVIFLFLRSFWATVIPGIVLPVVLVATFAGMYLFGYSIDNLSLMALTIAIGFLVDDAIVMIENIVRISRPASRPSRRRSTARARSASPFSRSRSRSRRSSSRSSSCRAWSAGCSTNSR